MKFLLELVACCGASSGTSMVKEEARLLATSVPPPSLGDRRRKRGRSGGPNGGGTGVDWRPSLSSICEENVFNERPTNEPPYRHREEVAVVRSPSSSTSSSERNLKRKITSTLRPRSNSPREDVTRRPAIHTVMPVFTPTPFMF